jgi:hypothetical protein
MQADKVEPQLPPLSCGEHLIEYLFEVGPMIAGGMGPVAVDWPHLDAWQRCVGLVLPPWQSRLLIRLSNDYIDEWLKAQDDTRPAPWQAEDMTEANRAAVSRQVSNAMKAFILSQESRK